MSCSTCQKTFPIPQCSGILQLGEVSISEGIAVITDIITGRRRSVPLEVETGGNALVDLTDFGAFLSPNFVYNIQVFDTGIENYNNPAPVTIDAIEYDCFELTFDNIVSADTGVILAPQQFTLKIYE